MSCLLTIKKKNFAKTKVHVNFDILSDTNKSSIFDIKNNGFSFTYDSFQNDTEEAEKNNILYF